MALPKVYGIETEYGIQAVGSREQNPTSAASMLVNAYANERSSAVAWDFDDESPGVDARGYVRDASGAPEVERHLANTVLTNGARFYVDHAHPEYSTPECSSPMQLVVHDRAGELVLQRAMEAARRVLPAGEEIVVYKNNSDGKGNSYGCHENYLVDRGVPFPVLARRICAHLVTRQIYTGAGKVGCEEEGRTTPAFELSQRADFFEEEIGLETTLKRPIVNTRDEPHSDPSRYRRLHVITGDANLSEVATFLKVGVTGLLLLLIEDDAFAGRELVLAQPVRAIHEISHDPSLRTTVELVDGSRVTALELQWELYRLALKYADERGLEALGSQEEGRLVLERWEQVLSGLESDPSQLASQLDWVAKHQLIDAYCARHRCDLDDARVSALDLQYHDLRPNRSVFAKLAMERLVDDKEVAVAVHDAPRTTRAFFRGECLKRFGASIVAANWDSIVFDLGSDPLRRVPMMEPLRGTAEVVGTLFEQCSSPDELLQRLGG
jgi:proteasome accessory factor PafA2